MAKTIKQIAEEIGVTKQAVFKKIKQEPLSTKLEKFISTVDGKVMVDVDGERLVKQAFKCKPKMVGGKVGGNKALVGGNGEQVDAGVVYTSEISENTLVTTLQLAVDTLARQLEEKDKQLTEKDKQLERQAKAIEELATSLAVAQHTAQAAQALHAGTIQRQIEEAPVTRAEEPEIAEETEEEPTPEQGKKKGFFSRLFGG